MKRIDDKIKEIEKKDKTNRLLYIGFVVLIAGFMAYVLITEKRNKRNIDTISKMDIEQTKTYKDLDSVRKSAENLYSDLLNSLRPEQYWDYIKNENSVEGYIAYITNDWGIDKEAYLPSAIENMKSSSPEAEGFKGWLWVGSKTTDGTYTSKDIVEVIYRKDANGDIKNSEIQIGDIIKLKTTQNRKTYKNNKLTRANELGWRNKTKAFVVNTWKNPNSTDFNIEIKYY